MVSLPNRDKLGVSRDTPEPGPSKDPASSGRRQAAYGSVWYRSAPTEVSATPG